MDSFSSFKTKRRCSGGVAGSAAFRRSLAAQDCCCHLWLHCGMKRLYQTRWHPRARHCLATSAFAAGPCKVTLLLPLIELSWAVLDSAVTDRWNCCWFCAFEDARLSLFCKTTALTRRLPQRDPGFRLGVYYTQVAIPLAWKHAVFATIFLCPTVMNNVPTGATWRQTFPSISRVVHEITSSQKTREQTPPALVQLTSLIWLHSALSSSFN